MEIYQHKIKDKAFSRYRATWWGKLLLLSDQQDSGGCERQKSMLLGYHNRNSARETLHVCSWQPASMSHPIDHQGPLYEGH